MSNPFKFLLPRATMTHAAFEKTLLGFEKVRLESQKNGEPQKGGLRCSGGAVGVRRNVPTKKGHQRETRAGAEDLIRYLKKNGQRFDPNAVREALTGLRAVKEGKGKNVDLTGLAEQHHGLMDTSVLITDFVEIRRHVQVASNEIHEAADGLIDGSIPHEGAQSPETSKATEQAMKDEARRLGKRFRDGCLPGAQQKHSKDAKRLFRWLGEELGVSDLTRRVDVHALDGLLDELELKLNDQKVALERLIAQAGSRDQDPEYHAQIKQLSEKYMTSQAVYCRMLAFVANVLVVRKNPIDLPPSFRLPTAAFAQSLLNLLRAQLAPGSDFMENNQWAAKAKAAAEKRLLVLNAPEVPVATQDTHAQRVGQLREGARKAYTDFETALLNEGQTPLRGAIVKSLRANPATERLTLNAVRGNLFDYLPDRIQEQHAKLSAEVLASEQTGHQEPLRLQRIRDIARSLDQLIEGYLAQLDAVSSILLTDHRVGDLPEDLDKKRLDAGHRMLQLRFVGEDPGGELKRIQRYAKQNENFAENARNVLGMKPAPEVRGTRPLHNKPAQAYESFPDAEVDERMAELMALDAAPPARKAVVDISAMSSAELASMLNVPLDEAEPKKPVERAYRGKGHHRAHVSELRVQPKKGRSATEENAAFPKELDRIEAERVATFEQPVLSTPPVLATNRPGWLAELPADEIEQLTTAIRSSRYRNDQQVSFSPPISSMDPDQALLQEVTPGASAVMLKGRPVAAHMSVAPQVKNEDDESSSEPSVQEQRALRRQNASVNLRGPRPTSPAAVQVQAPADDEPFGEDDDLLIDLRIALGDPTVPAHEIARQERELKQLNKGLGKVQRVWDK